MTSMIERVARAIATMNDGYDDAWSFYKSDARIAIEAMREPTDTMVDSGQDARMDGGGYYDIWRAMIDASLAEDK